MKGKDFFPQNFLTNVVNILPLVNILSNLGNSSKDTRMLFDGFAQCLREWP